ncbi:winged helix-turn-helix transcriptional regulator [Haloferax chudinovii]|uniref:Winged helix-turn-helix transcriptional regulator n=1 Tax=Haloferax chudinovii TaxID=1109010 RepID=A0ABD5XF66_9EURY
MSDDLAGVVAEFSVLDEADLVTSDDEDPVASAVDNGYEPGSTIDDSEDVEFEMPEFVAACRYCQTSFDTEADALEHEWNCDLEPTGECRFCGGTHIRKDVREDHFYSCSEAEQHERRQKRGVRARTMRGQDSKTAVSGLRKFLLPQPHEFSAYLKWDDSLSTYFGLVSLYKMHDFEEYGNLRAGIEFGGEEWNVEFSFKESGVATPEDDTDLGRWDWRLEKVPEFQVYVYPEAYPEYSEAVDDNRKRAYFKVSPRWPGIKSESGKNISNPHNILGVDVETKGSYFEFDQYPSVLYEALRELRERQDEFGWNSFTEIDYQALAPEDVHNSSNITDAELYVRAKRGETGRMYAFDGTLHRIALILGGERSGYSKTVRDDRECEGWYHTSTVCAMRAAQVVGGHELPKEIKHYHVKNPDAVAGTPLENPKIGVSYQNSLYDDTLRFKDVDRLHKELDEALLNVLDWSDLPVTPDHQKFVKDDYFKVEGEARMVKVVDNPLPRIAEQQDDEIRKFAVAGNMNETDLDVVEELLTDGGDLSPAEIADKIGKATSTVYDSLERLGKLVLREYGHVELASKHIAEGIVEHIESARRTVEATLEEAADDIIRADTYGDGNGPWERWLRNYVRDRKERDDGRELLELAPQATREEVKRILRTGASKWAEVTGNDWRQFVREFDVVGEAYDTSAPLTYSFGQMRQLIG